MTTLTTLISTLCHDPKDFGHLIEVLNDRMAEKSQFGSTGGSEHIKDIFRFHSIVYFLIEVHWWDRNRGGIGMAWQLCALDDNDKKPKILETEAFRNQFDQEKDHLIRIRERILGVKQDHTGVWYLELGTREQERYGVRPFRTPCGKTVGECCAQEKDVQKKIEYSYFGGPRLKWSRTTCKCGISSEGERYTGDSFPDPDGSWKEVKVSECILI